MRCCYGQEGRRRKDVWLNEGAAVDGKDWKKYVGKRDMKGH
jgi:hypothetical protein